MKATYLRFLQLTHAIHDGSSHLESVDETAKQLLNVIAVHHANGKPLTVTEAMALSLIASQATIHRKLDVLLEIGLIEQKFEGKNRRTKYLVPTKLADEHFANLGKAMVQVLVAD
jgi:DNA-binding MarR family transcriptional regulator